MNRHDDRFSRGRRSEYERDDWRHRERQGRERESFYPGNFGFERNEDTGRTAGGPEGQPFSRNPYGYYPGQGHGHSYGQSYGDSRGQPRGPDRYQSERFGQREPYNTGSRYAERGPFRGGRQDDDHDRRGMGGSRYSESQYGTSPGRRGFGGPGYGPSRESYGRGRYGSGVDARYGEERGFGEGPFEDMTEPPGYFGTGNYGDGGASPTGGFDQRTRRRNYGSLGQDTFSSDFSPARQWRADSQRRYRTGPKGYTRSDERLREDICERLMLADSVDPTEVSVTVKEGKVVLEGSVPNRGMKHTIEDLVDAAPGVQDIENRIRVERAESRWESSQKDTAGSGTSAAGSGTGASSTTQRTASPGSSSAGTTTQGASTGSGIQRRKE